MFLALLAATALPPALLSGNEERFAACLLLAEKEPTHAIDEATAWQIAGGGVLAKQCLGMALAGQFRWGPASLAFEQAAREAERNRDARAARLWVQAGNAALAGGEAAKARAALDTAIISGNLTGPERGEAHLDRARVLVALRQTRDARADLNEAVKLVPQDPLAWLLSATLARREGDLARAGTDIVEAVRLAPDDARVAMEAGNIAALQGNSGAARVAWEGAVKLAPESVSGKAAAEALKGLGAN